MSLSNVLRDQRQNLALISSLASQVNLGKVRDLIREAEYEIEQEEKRLEEMEDKRQPWVMRLEILTQAKGKWWVRWTGADGCYRWLHPDTNMWIEEPHQINMPMFKSELSISPVPFVVVVAKTIIHYRMQRFRAWLHWKYVCRRLRTAKLLCSSKPQMVWIA